MAMRFVEEIILLALDDESGKLHPLPDRALELAIAGALLLELAFASRIDTDQKQLLVLDRSPTGDVLLDRVLAMLPSAETTLIDQALSKVATEAQVFKGQILKSLVEQGVLRQEEHRFFFVLKVRRYPLLDACKEQEVVARIREVILEGVLPDPKDVVVICLMNACHLGSAVFSEAELEAHQERIKQIARMDFIGQALAKAVTEIQEAILESIAYMGL